MSRPRRPARPRPALPRPARPRPALPRPARPRAALLRPTLPRRLTIRPEAVPPDAGLQAERTSLSWARTWAVVTVNIILVAKLVAEASTLWAAVFSLLVVVPLAALIRVQGRHEKRVGRFLRAGEVEQTQALYNVGLVVMVLVMAASGVTAVLFHALT